jgi:hypothetical protein
MAYDIENALLQVTDRVGTSTANPVPAPAAGQTILYTTPQGIVAEQSAATWYLDKPTSLTLVGAGAAITATDSYVSLLAAPFTVPNTVESDSTTSTTYCVDLNFGYTFDGAAATSIGFYVKAVLSSGPVAEFFIAGNYTTATTGTAVIRWWFTAASGVTLDLQIKTIAAGDALVVVAAATQARYALVRRDFAA